MSVRLLLPQALATFAGGERELMIEAPANATVGEVLDLLSHRSPALARRIIDETGALRTFVNVYVGSEECRRLQGLATPVPDGCDVFVVGSIAGG